VQTDWEELLVGGVFLALGAVLIVARNRMAASSAGRQRRYYGAAASLFRWQTLPRYYLVVGSVFVAIGLFFGLAPIVYALRHG
jgi:hypothetical protein